MGAVRALGAALAFALLNALPNAATGQDTESAVYAAAQDCSGLRAYLRSYANGRYRADAQARMAKECEAPKQTNNPAPSSIRNLTTPPVAPVDPCIRARADWPQISGSSDLSILRAFLNVTPYDCQVQRAQATARISEVETAQREVAARQAAAQQAEANRIAAEQAAAQQRQATLNRSWSAIAISDWGDFWGTSYIDWGGVTGQSSPAAALAAAIKACDSKGDGKNCEAAIDPFNEGCGAFAYKGSDLTDGGWGAVWRTTESEARQAALTSCDTKGCEVKMVICARPG